MLEAPMWGIGWFSYSDEQHPIPHTLPNYDLGQHYLTADCPCCPTDDEDVIIHNSFDGREAYETEQRKRH